MKNCIKSWNIFKRVLFILFIMFLINYFSVQSGYYEKTLYDKTVTTEEKRLEFEEDIKNGEMIDMKDYVSDDYVDTSNGMDLLGQRIGNGLDDFINNKVIKVMEFFGNLFK